MLCVCTRWRPLAHARAPAFVVHVRPVRDIERSNHALMLAVVCRYLTRVKSEVRHKVVTKWCKQVLEGLNHLHSMDPVKVHGDVRCDNIYIDAETGNVRLGNFSLMHPSEEDPIRLTIGG